MASRTAPQNASTPLDAEAWIDAGFEALAEGGIDAVRIDPLAKSLGVTRGSFYWHFTDRAALHQAMLKEWRKRASYRIGSRIESRTSDARERLKQTLAPAELDAARETRRRDRTCDPSVGAPRRASLPRRPPHRPGPPQLLRQTIRRHGLGPSGGAKARVFALRLASRAGLHRDGRRNRRQRRSRKDAAWRLTPDWRANSCSNAR